jgi:hypothetical protein
MQVMRHGEQRRNADARTNELNVGGALIEGETVAWQAHLDARAGGQELMGALRSATRSRPKGRLLGRAIDHGHDGMKSGGLAARKRSQCHHRRQVPVAEVPLTCSAMCDQLVALSRRRRSPRSDHGNLAATR